MTTDPLAGPFPTGHQLCDASNDEGYAIPVAEAAAPSRATLLRQAAIGQ
jgi:hypothetical protein